MSNTFRPPETDAQADDRLAAAYEVEPSDTRVHECLALAAYVGQAPIALLSTPDSQKQWVFPADSLDVEAARRLTEVETKSLAGHMSAARVRVEPTVVLRGLPPVQGVDSFPIVSSAERCLGRLTLFQAEPRPFSPDQSEALQRVVRQLARLLVLREETQTKIPWPNEAAVLFRALADHVVDGFEVVDADTGRFLDVNERACRDHGYTRDEYLSLTVSDVEPTIANQPWDRVVKLVRLQGSMKLESEHRRKDGSHFSVEVHWSFVELDRGYCLAVVRDITERKQVEMAERMGERLRGAILNSLSAHVAVLDRTGRIIAVNRAWEEFAVRNDSGGSAPIGIGVSYLEACERAAKQDPDVRETLEGIRKVLEGSAESFVSHYPCETTDGRRCFVMRVTPLVDQDGGVVVVHEDVTAQWRIEAELIQQRTQLKAIVDGTSDAVYIKDVDGRYVLCNEAAGRFIGQAPERILGRDDTACFPLPEAQGLMEVDRAIMAGGRISSVEENLTTGDEVRRTFLTTKGPLFDVRGRVCGLFGIARDITDRKRLEETLRQREERYRGYFELGLIGMAVTSTEQGWIEVNDRLCEILGYPRSVLTTKTWVELTHPDDVAADLAQFERVLAGEIDGDVIEKRFVRGDGQIVSVLISAKAVRQADGGVDHFVAFVQDISEWKRAEEEGERHRRRLQLQIDEMPLAHIGWDADFRVVSWNPAAQQMFGYRAEEVIGHQGTFLVPPELRGEVEQIWGRFLEGDRSAHSINDNVTKQGRRITCRWTNAPLRGPDGTVLGAFSMVADVSDQRRAEQHQEGQRAVLELIATQASLETTLTRLCQSIEGQGGGHRCSVLVVEGGCLRSVAGPSLPASYRRVVDGLPIEEGMGSCGTAAFRNEPVISHDILTDPLWVSFRHHAVQAGLHNCWSVPVRDVDGVMIGALAVYNWGRLPPSSEDQALMNVWVHLAGIAIGRHRAERGLRDREAHLVSAQAQAHLGSWTWDIASGAHTWSDEQYRIFGYTPRSIHPSYDLFMGALHPQDRDRVAALLWKAVQGRASYVVECRIIRPGGDLRWIDCRGDVRRNDAGHPIQMTGTVLDLTDRKRAEERSALSEERFRLVAEATNDVLWDWDLTTHAHWWSPNARNKFGYDPESEPNITAWENRLHPDDKAEILSRVDQALGGNAPTLVGEYRFRLADGSYGHFLDRGRVIRDETGRPIRMIGAMIDVTELKRTHQSLQHALTHLQNLTWEVQLTETRERASLARELHDEFGQLLTAAKLNASWLQTVRLTRMTPGIRAQHAAKAKTLCEVLEEAIKGIRHVATQLRPAVLDHLGVSGAIEELVSSFERRFGTTCEACIAEALRSRAFGAIEGAALYRTVQEALTNVAKHAGATRVRLSLTDEGDQVRLVVSDNGCGLPAEALSKRGRWGIKGLRERAELLGGRLTIRSQAGEGTCIDVTMPMGRTVRARADEANRTSGD